MTSALIDFRSDACSMPTDSMRHAMATADIGNDDFGDDPTILRLEARIAELLGKEAAIFVQSGTMANMTAVMSHVEPGGTVLISNKFHIFDYEEAAMRRVAGCTFRFVEESTTQGETRLAWHDDLLEATAETAAPQLLCLENTINRLGGTVIPVDHLGEVSGWARKHGLPVHLDGARLFNAAQTLGVEPHELAAFADTVMVVFTKSLCAPAGGALVGDRESIGRARRFRWMLGGSWKQGGVIAAACLEGLDTLRDRIGEDHQSARMLAEGLNQIDGFEINLERVVSNIMFLQVTDPGLDLVRVTAYLNKRGAYFGRFKPDRRCRLVTHRGTDLKAVEQFLAWMREAVEQQRAEAA